MGELLPRLTVRWEVLPLKFPMKAVQIVIAAALFPLSTLLAGYGHALEFDVATIPLHDNHQVRMLPYASAVSTDPMLLVIESPDMDEREKQTRRLPSEPPRGLRLFRRTDSGWVLHLEQELDSGMDLVDTVRIGKQEGLAGYRSGELHLLDDEAGAFHPILEARSIYVGSYWGEAPQVRLFRDLDRDGRDDLLMPGFDGWQVALQTAGGFAPTQTVGPGPRMEFSDSSQLVGFRAEAPHGLDRNRDGLEDLAFWIDGRFEVYQQTPDRTFAAAPHILDPEMYDVLGSFLSVSLDGGDDEGEDDAQRLLDAVGDLDNDGMADLVIQRIMGDGIFGLETRYEIHRGRIGSDGMLSFEAEASSIVSSNGVQLANERLDLTGDGRQEFMVTSVNITLGAIIGALLTRSASIDLGIYRMEDGVFPDEPRLKKKLKVRFDFSNGDFFMPTVLGADLTGDGRKDLIVQRDEKSLDVYTGEPTDDLFAKNPIRLDLALPEEREAFLVTDLDRDGREELVLHLDDDEGSRLSVVSFSGGS
jgi:hypothetical protein